jgi:hypothetical protein
MENACTTKTQIPTRARFWILLLGVDINGEAFNAARVIIWECVENGSILGSFDGMRDKKKKERKILGVKK